jgi:hypothetical protein
MEERNGRSRRSGEGGRSGRIARTIWIATGRGTMSGSDGIRWVLKDKAKRRSTAS